MVARAVITAIGALVVAAHTATALAALPTADAKCRAALALRVRKLAVSALKAGGACHAARMAGALSASTQCNDSGVLPAAYVGRVLKDQQKLISKAAKKCAQASVPPLLGYLTCPDPCGLMTISDYASVAQCLACLTRDRVDMVLAATYGEPASPLSDAEAAGCQALIGSGTRHYFKQRMRQQQTCQGLLDRDLIPATACMTFDPAPPGSVVAELASNVVAASVVKDQAITECDDAVDIGAALDSCGPSEAAVQACAAATVDIYTDDLFNQIYFPPTPKPTATRTPTATTIATSGPTSTPTHPGGEANTIFVSAALGSDANPGTRLAPKQSIQAGITAATAGKRVCVDGGLYQESLTLKSGVTVEGGFDSTLDWIKTFAATVVEGGKTAVAGSGISNAKIANLQIYSASTSSPSASSSYGIRLFNPSGVIIDNCSITSRDAAHGADGTVGAAGQQTGTTFTGGYICDAGGNSGGGDQSCGGSGGAASIGGALGGASAACGGNADGQNGQPGSAGAPGVPAALTGVALGNYSAPFGSAGENGFPGGGGGAGIAPFYTVGTGGAGGCGGHGATPARGGGASLGIFIQATSGGTVTITDTSILTGLGGNGGDGAVGGAFLAGQFGEVGEDADGGIGPNVGGKGGNGGKGGASAGAPGGPSIGIFCDGTPALDTSGGVAFLIGSAGASGVSASGAAAPPAGLALNTYGCP